MKGDYVLSEIISRMGLALYHYSVTLEDNLRQQRSSATRYEAIADNAQAQRATCRMFQKRVEEWSLQFLEEMDDWLPPNDVDSSAHTDSGSLRSAVGVYRSCARRQGGLEP